MFPFLVRGSHGKDGFGRYLVTTVIGVAGATAIYLYGRKSVESIISTYLWPAGGNARLQAKEDRQEGDDQEAASDLVGTMDTHFRFIQAMATPQEELARLLPSLQIKLNQMTDIQQLRPSDAQQPPPPASERLKSLARLCFARVLSGCWLIPLLELLIRVKLNIIGRHLYLQEKLGALAGPLSYANWKGGAQGGDMPAQLSPAAIESFMSCDTFVENMLEWVVGKVFEGVDAVLKSQSLEVEITPHQLLETMARMISEIDACMCSCGIQDKSEAPWSILLCGMNEDANIATKVQQAAVAGTDAYRQAMGWAAAVQELHVELRKALDGAAFSEALRASIELTFRTAAVHILAAIPRPEVNTSASSGGLEISNAGSTTAQAQPQAPLMIKRPMARLLKPVQSACDPLFSSAKQTAKDITKLPSVKGLCASIFAAPLKS